MPFRVALSTGHYPSVTSAPLVRPSPHRLGSGCDIWDCHHCPHTCRVEGSCGAAPPVGPGLMSQTCPTPKAAEPCFCGKAQFDLLTVSGTSDAQWGEPGLTPPG